MLKRKDQLINLACSIWKHLIISYLQLVERTVWIFLLYRQSRRANVNFVILFSYIYEMYVCILYNILTFLAFFLSWRYYKWSLSTCPNYFRNWLILLRFSNDFQMKIRSVKFFVKKVGETHFEHIFLSRLTQIVETILTFRAIEIVLIW